MSSEKSWKEICTHITHSQMKNGRKRRKKKLHKTTHCIPSTIWPKIENGSGVSLPPSKDTLRRFTWRWLWFMLHGHKIRKRKIVISLAFSYCYRSLWTKCIKFIARNIPLKWMTTTPLQTKCETWQIDDVPEGGCNGKKRRHWKKNKSMKERKMTSSIRKQSKNSTSTSTTASTAKHKPKAKYIEHWDSLIWMWIW